MAIKSSRIVCILHFFCAMKGIFCCYKKLNLKNCIIVRHNPTLGSKEALKKKGNCNDAARKKEKIDSFLAPPSSRFVSCYPPLRRRGGGRVDTKMAKEPLQNPICHGDTRRKEGIGSLLLFLVLFLLLSSSLLHSRWVSSATGLISRPIFPLSLVMHSLSLPVFWGVGFSRRERAGDGGSGVRGPCCWQSLGFRYGGTAGPLPPFYTSARARLRLGGMSVAPFFFSLAHTGSAFPPPRQRRTRHCCQPGGGGASEVRYDAKHA